MACVVVDGRVGGAGRAMAGITRTQLADACGYSEKAVYLWKKTNSVKATRDSIIRAFGRQKVLFLAYPEPGVRLRS